MSFDMDLESVLKATVLEALLGKITFFTIIAYSIRNDNCGVIFHRKSNMCSKQTPQFGRNRCIQQDYYSGAGNCIDSCTDDSV